MSQQLSAQPRKLNRALRPVYTSFECESKANLTSQKIHGKRYAQVENLMCSTFTNSQHEKLVGRGDFALEFGYALSTNQPLSAPVSCYTSPLNTLIPL